MSIVASASEDENQGEGFPWEEGARPGDFGNTQGANRQKGLSIGGEDTVEYSLGVQWKEYTSLVDVLDEAKKRVQETKFSALEAKFGDAVFVVYRKGRATGGGRGVYFDFKLDAYGTSILIAKQATPLGHTPNVRVVVGSTTMMVLGGLREASIHVERIIISLGGQLLWEKLSRVDPCIDLTTVNTHDLVKLIETGHMICRADVSDLHRFNERYTGVSVGKGGDVMLRIYDKAHEVYNVTRDSEKAALLEELRWGGKVKSALRAEYQLRRKALRSLGLENTASYLKNRAAALRYLTEEWFRIAIEPPDRENRNTQRVETHPLWKKVVGVLSEAYGKSETSAKRVEIAPHRNADRNGKLFLGSGLGTVADRNQGASLPVDGLRDELKNALMSECDKVGSVDLLRRYEAKAAIVRAREVKWRKRP